MLTRRGVTVFEILVAAAIVGILGMAIWMNPAAASRPGGEAAAVDLAARTLAEIADAAGRTTGTGGATSFNQVIGQDKATVTANAQRLSHLTAPITTDDVNSCYYNYEQAEVGRWLTPFYYRNLPRSAIGFKIAPGYIARDSLQRYNAPGEPTTLANRPPNSDAFAYGTTAIVMPNTELSAALALLARVEGDQSGELGAVRYFPKDGTTPVTLEYHFTIRGC